MYGWYTPAKINNFEDEKDEYIRFSAVAYCKAVYDLKINTAYIPR